MRATSICLLAATALLLAPRSACAQTAPGTPAPVYAVDLERGTPIVGLLGVHLGELTWIKARIVGSRSKSEDRIAEVLEINGHRLSEPIDLAFSVWEWGNLSSRELPVGAVMSLRVYETGGMVGVPRAALEETVMVAAADWRFQTSLVLLYEQR